MTNLAPIVVFGYNRPGHLRQTLTYLARAEGAKHSDLWIFCDGLKSGADLKLIEEVRQVAVDPLWEQRFSSVRITFSETNKGLARSIIGGVSRVLEGAENVIVIEDDLLIAPDFLNFMNDCLIFYRDDRHIGSITGFSPLTAYPPGYRHDVMAVPRNCSHGWATWGDRWREVDWEARGAIYLWRDAGMRHRFNTAGSDRLDRLRRQLNGSIDSWSIRFGLWQSLSGRVTIYPVHNRVCNIGFDGSGVHTRIGQDINADALTEARPYRLEHVNEDPIILSIVHRVYSGQWYESAYRNLRTWLLTRGA